jgi:hypothetical protein
VVHLFELQLQDSFSSVILDIVGRLLV